MASHTAGIFSSLMQRVYSSLSAPERSITMKSPYLTGRSPPEESLTFISESTAFLIYCATYAASSFEATMCSSTSLSPSGSSG